MTNIACIKPGHEITIHGITYVVILSETADEKRAQGYANTARLFDENGIHTEMVLRRPKGRKHFIGRMYEDGTFSRPITLP